MRSTGTDYRKKIAAKKEIYFKENSNLEIIADFELASINSINEVFNFAIQSACFFNFTQSIYRKIQNVGHSNKYLNDDNFNLLARKIPALAFLPINIVRNAWSNLKIQFSNDEMNSNLYYILMRTIFTVKLEYDIAIIEHRKEMNQFSLLKCGPFRQGY